MGNTEITVTCPKCKHPFTVPSGQFEADSELECLSCGHVLGNEENRLEAAFDRIGKQLHGMQDLR